MSTVEFFKADFPATLFPLKTNWYMVDKHSAEIDKYIYQKVLDEASEADNFLPQQRVYATKPRGHLRRTVKLDPVAEYFIYDLTFRNRSIFRGEVSSARRSFGYKFAKGSQVLVHTAYRAYKAAIADGEKEYKHKVQFDVASYFNSIYHHDLMNWFAGKAAVSEADAQAFGKYFREINAGRSVDFLPQGIYPSKMLGNEFLKYIDLTGFLKSSLIVRFMDDFNLFDDDPSVLQQDFIRIQQLLGQNGLNINPSKTFVDKSLDDVQDTLSEVQKSLVAIVYEYYHIETASGVELIEVEEEVKKKLSPEQIDALLALLKDESLEESDAERILIFLRSHSDSVLEHIPMLLARFPNLMKHIHAICETISEKKELASAIMKFLNENSFFLEFQLFWLAAIVEDFLMGVGSYGEILLKLYEVSADFKIARAKVLEIPEQGFGFKEIRGEFLKTGQSDWLSWASAIGTHSLKAAERNYVLTYFSKCSPMNYLISECARKI